MWCENGINPKTGYLALPSIEHQNCTLGRKCHIHKHGSANWYVHTHIYTYSIYFVTLLPCVLIKEDMTVATANSRTFIFIFTFTFQENKENRERQTHWYLRNRYQHLSCRLSIYTIYANTCSAHVVTNWIDQGPLHSPTITDNNALSADIFREVSFTYMYVHTS